MPNTTSDYWDVDGVSLNTYVQNLETWGEGRESPAPLRGEDITIPYAAGQTFVPKVPDSRPMGLRGWLTAERTGFAESEATLKQNWRELRALLWRPWEEFELTKRWTEDGVSRTATALAQFAGGLEPEVKNRHLKFEVELKLADPFFYAPERSQAITAFNAYEFLAESGDYGTKKVFIDLVGPLTGIKIMSHSGSTTSSSKSYTVESTLSYPDIPSGTTVTIDVEKFKATSTTGGVVTKTSGLVTNTLSPYWFQMGKTKGGFEPRWRVNAAGTGTVTLRYRPAYH